MQFANILAFGLGAIIEVLLLIETANRQKFNTVEKGVFNPRFNFFYELIVLVLLICGLPTALIGWFNLRPDWNLVRTFSDGISILIMLFLLAFGILLPLLLPRVNEQTIVVVNILALFSLPPDLPPLGLMLVAGASLGVLLAALTKRRIPAWLKSLLYFWYLICLLFIYIGHDYKSLYDANTMRGFDPLGYIMGGAASLFIYLHCAFLLRFSLMLTANILPGNRQLIADAMPQLFTDQQLPLPILLVIVAVVVAVLLANRSLGFALPANLIGLLILFAAHLMDFLAQKASPASP